MVPNKLKPGDEVRIIAPSRSMAIISDEVRSLATQRLESMGLKVTYGKNIEECDQFNSSSIESRVEDLHAAFADPNVKAILTVIGGFNCNQLLKHIRYDLIRGNPKILCGYSDITALQNAIYAKTGLVTYSGPHFSTMGIKHRMNFTLEHFKQCLFSDDAFDLAASPFWSDDAWYLNQENRNFIPNEGYQVIQPGSATGTILGGNTCTFNLLQGTEYMPSLKDSILFLEDDELAGALTDVEFDRNLQSIIHQPGFSGVRGIVIGRFQKKSEMTVKKLNSIITSKAELSGLPIIYGVDFGHTEPFITFPIGGEVTLNTDENKIIILQH